ncbi:uncharacterized protein B0I36DRAFT_99861 [Microdochium trichocladiopsis]|uniref:C2H2-type domain-containing protein n=1 Tax=Microdochium trichocladiopsis TaxID=1682393 RepID=A0A9P9BP32_9PEZI|nr:uncharacterized protein B0I36DRAFT_99861 [Microdochium trichocladiopsis]KAH7032709.1 hypothetical protein B0I36DRAFT_99861 [Microdochium trichocladiopsis]
MSALEAKDILEDAINSFRQRHPAAVTDRFIHVTCDHVKHDILELQIRQEKQKSMLNLARFQSALLAFEQLVDAARLSQEQAGFIWGPTKQILKSANDERSILDTVLNAYYELGTCVPRTVPHEDLLQARPELRKALAYMYHDVLLFHADVLGPLTSGEGWKRTFKANWNDYVNHSFRALLRRFDQHHQLFKSQLDSCKEGALEEALDDFSYRLNGHVQDYREDRDDFLRHIRQYEEDRRVLLRNARDAEAKRKEDQLEKMLAWLSTPGVDQEQEEHHQRFRDIREEAKNTCQWILQDDHMLNWLNPETVPRHSIIWIHGKLGCGKTVLASSIIDRCMRYRSSIGPEDSARDAALSIEDQQPVFKTSFFYCREEGSRQNDTMTIYRSLLRQMLRHFQDLLPVCHEKKAKGQVTLNHEETAQILLELFADADMNQFIIIDGIDSCNSETRRVVVNFLAKLAERCEEFRPGKLRVLLVSRDLPDIRKLKVVEGATTIIEMTTRHVQDDIGLYIDGKKAKMKDRGLDENDIQRIRRQILRRSDGMFLYAQIVMDNLLAQSAVGDILAELEESRFPRDLASAYNAIVERLKNQLSPKGWKRAQRVFGWLACCKRPLLWHEIQAALVISHDKHSGELVLDYYKGRLQKDIDQTCGSLVQVLKGRITFVHHTAREHILQGENLDERVVECELAIACLQYLGGSCFRPGDDPKQLDKFVEDKFYAFQDYAASKWDHHLGVVLKNGTGIFEDPVRGGSFQIKLSRAATAFTTAFAKSLEPRDHSGSKRSAISEPERQAEDARQKAESDCQAFRCYSFYDAMVVIRTHLHFHEATSDAKQRNKISLHDLEGSIQKIRGRMESTWLALAEGGEEEAQFQEYYGLNVFKCDRIACDYFYQGFENQELRDAHTKRHERPFLCPVAGCNLVAFGFSTNKDREKHVRSYHPDDPANTGFGPVPRDLTPASKDNARFNCPHCGKNFTRKAIREDHINAHFGQRPHQCSLCDKAFTRANDLRRHMTQKHSRRIVR